MAKLNRCIIAQCSNENLSQMLIDSGATHHFFYSRPSFKSYEKGEVEEVKSSSGLSTIVWKGQVWLLIDDGIYVQAYYTPHFSTNIWSVSLLSEKYNIGFTTYFPARDVVSTCFITRKQTKKLVESIKVNDDLFSIPHSPQKYEKCQAIELRAKSCLPTSFRYSVCCDQSRS